MNKPKTIDDYPVPYIMVGLLAVSLFGGIFYGGFLIVLSGFFLGLISSFIIRRSTERRVLTEVENGS